MDTRRQTDGHTQADRSARRRAGDPDTRADGRVGRSRRGQQPAAALGVVRAPGSPGPQDGCPALRCSRSTKHRACTRDGNTEWYEKRDSLDPKAGRGRLYGQAPPTVRPLASPPPGTVLSLASAPEPRVDGTRPLLLALPAPGWEPHVTLPQACSSTGSDVGAWLPPHIVVLWPVVQCVGRDR